MPKKNRACWVCRVTKFDWTIWRRLLLKSMEKTDNTRRLVWCGQNVLRGLAAFKFLIFLIYIYVCFCICIYAYVSRGYICIYRYIWIVRRASIIERHRPQMRYVMFLIMLVICFVYVCGVLCLWSLLLYVMYYGVSA